MVLQSVSRFASCQPLVYPLQFTEIPPPRFLNNSGRAKRAIYRKTAASKINAKLKKGKAKTALCTFCMMLLLTDTSNL